MAKIAPFEAHRNRYEQWFEDNRFAYEAEIEAVRLLLPKGGEGLEVGVGTGRFAVPPAHLYRPGAIACHG